MDKMLSGVLTQHRTGVHNPQRIQRIFDGAQHRKLDRVTIFLKVSDFQTTDAMFRADRPFHAVHKVMHNTFDSRPFSFIIVTIFAQRWKHIVVQITIAQMPKAVDPESTDFSQDLRAAFNE